MYMTQIEGQLLRGKAVVVSVPGAVILGVVTDVRILNEVARTLVLSNPVYADDVCYFQGVGEHETSLKDAYGDRLGSSPASVNVDSIIFLCEAERQLALLCKKAQK